MPSASTKGNPGQSAQLAGAGGHLVGGGRVLNQTALCLPKHEGGRGQEPRARQQQLLL